LEDGTLVASTPAAAAPEAPADEAAAEIDVETTAEGDA
jgi:hypothetical protein